MSKQWFKSQCELLFVFRVDDGLNTKSYLVQREYRVDDGLDTKSYLVQRELLFVYRVDDGLNTKELSVTGLRKCEQLF